MLSSSHFTVGASQLVKMISKLGLGGPACAQVKKLENVRSDVAKERERERGREAHKMEDRNNCVYLRLENEVLMARIRKQ